QDSFAKLYFQGIWLEILGIVRGTSSSAMLGLMESPLHHFFDDRTDAAALDALMRGDWYAGQHKNHGSSSPRRQTADVSQGPLVEVGLCRVNLHTDAAPRPVNKEFGALISNLPWIVRNSG